MTQQRDMEAARLEGDSKGEGVSLFEIGSLLILNRFRLVGFAFLGAFVAVLPAMFSRPQYVARATFMPKGSDNGSTSGLRNIAGQFGINIPGMAGGSPLQSPAFLTEIVKSPMILDPIIGDTITVPEKGKSSISLLDLLEIRPDAAPIQRAAGVKALAKRIEIQTSRQTQTLTLLVATDWPSVSLRIATRILDELNRFNLRVGQSDASQERRFVEAEMDAQRKVLGAAEGRLSAFVRSNRQYGNSPDLTFEHDRLEREVSLQQQVLVGLAQANEDARIREVRDVPVLTVIEPPTLPLKPEPRGRLRLALMGGLIGAVIGVFLVLVADLLRRARASKDPDAEQFFAIVRSTLSRRKKTPTTVSGSK